MNGRAYDYNLGRFLSVDPVIQFPENSQSLNPYSYIMNNPMSGTDPTGYCDAATGTRIADCRVVTAVYQDSNGNEHRVSKETNVKSRNDLESKWGGYRTHMPIQTNNGHESTKSSANVESSNKPENIGEPKNGSYSSNINDYGSGAPGNVSFGDVLWEDLVSGAIRDQGFPAMGTEALNVLTVSAGVAEIALIPGTGGLGFTFLGAHGVGNILGGTGDYLNVWDNGDRDWNIARRGYEKVFEFAGQPESSGARAFYLTDAGMGLGGLLRSVRSFSKVRFANENEVGGFEVQWSRKELEAVHALKQGASGAIIVTHEMFQIGLSAYSGVTEIPK